MAVVARIASIFCTDVTAGNWLGGPRAVYDAYATTRRPQQAQPQLPFRGGHLYSGEGLHFQTEPGAHSRCKWPAPVVCVSCFSMSLFIAVEQHRFSLSDMRT